MNCGTGELNRISERSPRRRHGRRVNSSRGDRYGIIIEALEQRQFLTAAYHLSMDDEFNTLKLSNYITTGVNAGQLVDDTPANSGWLTRDAYDDTGFNTSNGELEYYANPATDSYNPFSISNGTLSITAKPTPSAMQGSGAGQTSEPYVSGMLTSAQGFSYEPYNTSDGFSQQYGYFEMRCEVPSGPGMWPAFWMVPEPKLNTSNTNAEYDIFEIPVNSNTKLNENTKTIYQTSHLNNTSEQNVYSLPTGEDASKGFHTYGFEWDASNIRWYVDGVLTATMTNVCNTPMYLLMNLAVGGTWPGSPNSSTKFPASFKIEYVRAYSDDPNVAAVAPQSGYSVDADTLDAISLEDEPEPAMGGAILVGLIYLAGRERRFSRRKNAGVALNAEP